MQRAGSILLNEIGWLSACARFENQRKKIKKKLRRTHIADIEIIFISFGQQNIQISPFNKFFFDWTKIRSRDNLID